MELKEFIKEAVVQIVNGVEDARKELADVDVLINPCINERGAVANEGNAVGEGERQPQNIEINVAITVEGEGSNAKGLSVFTGFFAIGGQSSNNERTSAVNTLRFNVPISLPYEKTIRKPKQ
ncbi:hypothetical protein [Sphingobacterium sp. LRF_L2]|uniref:hypothetical protein n=1 Tax=Sphingobacterium sp. LRF_L2 TaxID=3369421 RepID=UPI003F61BCD0